MSYFPDLTSSFHEDAPHAQYVSRTPAVYVGWLAPEEGHAVNTGPAPEDFVEVLRWAIKAKYDGGPFHDGMGTRGFHTCTLSECPKGRESSGSYHLTIPGEKRGYYVPALIRHYVEHHQYQPPQEFVEVVMGHWRKHKGIQESQSTRGVVRRMLNEAKGPNFMITRTGPGGLTVRAYVSGYEVGHVTFESAGGFRGHLGNLFVKPEYRGQGYGKALAERVAEEARASGFCRIEADVTSQKSYKALVSALGEPVEKAFESISEVPATSYFDVGGEGKPSESWAVAWDL